MLKNLIVLQHGPVIVFVQSRETSKLCHLVQRRKQRKATLPMSVQYVRVNGSFVNDDVFIEHMPIVFMDAASEWQFSEYPE